MFKVVRPDGAPACLAQRTYNGNEVVEILHKIFHGKCYLCEQDELSDPEIEHFDPHEGDEGKKFDWRNLYYACGRCNSIKSNIHRDLLDCCDNSIDVFRAIKCAMPSMPDDPVVVTATSVVPDGKTLNTVRLLDRCYNEKNTALRGVTRSVLMEKMYAYYTELLNYRLIMRSKKSTDDEKKFAKERIAVMLRASFPFSVFWRWQVLGDGFLRDKLRDEIDF